MTCAICGQRPAIVGILCDGCQAKIIWPVPLAPEQIALHGQRATTSGLVDQWGRVHPLDAVTCIGRIIDGPTLGIFTPTVSLRHALLTRNGRVWTVTDLSSSNGVHVDDVRIVGEVKVPDRARLRIGRVGFYFLADVSRIAIPSARPIGKTRPPSEGDAQVTLELTVPMTRVTTFEFHQPTGGGGALATIDGKQIQLTLAQLELLTLLVNRMNAEKDGDEATRGYVTIEELLTDLSLESSEAAAVNVRQLVRRVRRLLIKAGIGDLIESRYARGYRLRTIPHLK